MSGYTSIWVDHLRSGSAQLSRLLEAGTVLAHPWVIGELALGNLSCRREVMGLLQGLPEAVVATDHELLILRAMDRIHNLLNLGQGRAAARETTSLLTMVRAHNAKEEAGIYAMLIANEPRYVASLAREHELIDDLLRASAHTSEGRDLVARGLRHLRDHIFTEEQDTYPYAFQTLSMAQWDFINDIQAGFSG
jgi:hypothetical protein